jgi:hypothetical protein
MTDAVLRTCARGSPPQAFRRLWRQQQVRRSVEALTLAERPWQHFYDTGLAATARD